MKIICLAAALLLSHSAMSNTYLSDSLNVVSGQTTETGTIDDGVVWSKAKDNCKKLGGSWKPIRQICKIKSITIEGL